MVARLAFLGTLTGLTGCSVFFAGFGRVADEKNRVHAPVNEVDRLSPGVDLRLALLDGSLLRGRLVRATADSVVLDVAAATQDTHMPRIVHLRRFVRARSDIDHLEIRRGRYEYEAMFFGGMVDVAILAIVYPRAASNPWTPTRMR